MRKTVCIFCASSASVPEEYRQAASGIGVLCAQKGIRIVYGAGAVGLMGACADACMNNGGEMIGVIPQFMVDRGWCRANLTECVITSDMAIRRQKMRDMSDGVIVLPGGCGTLEELFETVTQRQMGFFTHPIILVNINHYFDPLIEWMRNAVKENFMQSEHLQLWSVSQTIEEALELFQTEADTEGVLLR